METFDFWFHKVYCKAFYVTLAFCQSADDLQYECPQPDYENYLVSFDTRRIDDIAFLEYCIMRNTIMAGKAGLHHIDVDAMNKLQDFLNHNHPAYIKAFIQPNRSKAATPSEAMEGYYEDRDLLYASLDRFKIQYNAIYDEIKGDEEVSTKWRSEYRLFRAVQYLFPLAVHQYRAPWLRNLSLDIFIPEKQIAVEYQGEQHYLPVEYLGGIARLKERQALDSKKRELCKQNLVQLIEWKYTEPISVDEVRRRIKIIAP